MLLGLRSLRQSSCESGKRFFRVPAKRTNQTLVEQLKDYGFIKSTPVIEALSSVDRGNYTKKTTLTYRLNEPLTIGFGQTISASILHATVLELFKDHLVAPNTRVLDVGSGSGFLTACFAKMVHPSGHVFGIDRIPELVAKGEQNLKEGNPELIPRDILGILQEWPYNVIHVGAASEEIPAELVAQLQEGGRMIIPLGKKSQVLTQVDLKDGKLHQTPLFNVLFVPLIDHVETSNIAE